MRRRPRGRSRVRRPPRRVAGMTLAERRTRHGRGPARSPGAASRAACSRDRRPAARGRPAELDELGRGGLRAASVRRRRRDPSPSRSRRPGSTSSPRSSARRPRPVPIAAGDDAVARARAYRPGARPRSSVLCEPHWFGGSLADLTRRPGGRPRAGPRQGVRRRPAPADLLRGTGRTRAAARRPPPATPPAAGSWTARATSAWSRSSRRMTAA